MNHRESFRQLEEVFHQLEALDGPAREARLRAIASESPALHDELCKLFDVSTGITRQVDVLGNLASAVRELSGNGGGNDPQRIGPYRLAGLLGEGGMGRVYRAEQVAPVQRTVALKLTRVGMDSDVALARFQAERQALAVLDHPGIARVFDAGSSEDGRPWFAMELIDGVPITRWVAERSLGLRQRIELLLRVCDAVQHAHRKGLIHRDLKPSNILVVDDGGIGLPKVIDFGIAKLTDFALADGSAATAFGELLGTPEYMSPEQASMGEIDIDTRSDVYALGLILHELLVGELPVTQRALREMGFEAMCRVIREGDTPRPSMYCGARADVETASWSDKLRGDLDSVLLKSLAKDREQRYGSAAALAEDLRRYLDDEPVLALPPSFGYRAGKFARRHRLPVLAAAAVLVALLAGTVVAALGLLEARRAETRALTSAAEALHSKAVAEQASEFLVELFSGADPRDNPGLALTARELLERGESRIVSLDDAPAVQARLLEVLGDVYWSLGAFDRAEPILERGIAMHRQGMLADPKRLSAMLDRLGGLRRDRDDLAGAEALYREALALLAAAGIQDGEHVARSLNNLGIVLRRSDRLDEAAETYTRALAITEALPELDGDASASARARIVNLRANLGSVHQARGDYLAARDAVLAAIDLAVKELPPEHPFLGGLQVNLARALMRLGEPLRAREAGSRALAIERIAYAPDHPLLAETLLLMGQIELQLGNFEQAAAHFDEGQAIVVAGLGSGNRLARIIAFEKARLDLLQGNGGAAREGFARLVESEPSVADAAATQRHLAMACRASGASACAAEASGLAAARGAEGRDREEQALALLLQALLASEAGRGEEGTRYYEDALRIAGCPPAGPCAALDDAARQIIRAHWWALRGDADAAFAHLDFAVQAPTWTAWMLDAREFATLHADPRWRDFQARLAARVREQ